MYSRVGRVYFVHQLSVIPVGPTSNYRTQYSENSMAVESTGARDLPRSVFGPIKGQYLEMYIMRQEMAKVLFMGTGAFLF